MKYGNNEIQIIKAGLIIASLLILFSLSLILGLTRVEGIWFIFPIMAMRISTGISAILCFSIVIFLQRRRTLASIYYAIIAVIFSMGLYEFVWYYTAVALRGYEPRLFQFGALFGWILLGIKEVYQDIPPKISVVLYLSYISSMVLWVATGFQFNDIGNPIFSYWGEFLNIISKASIDFGYALHIGSKINLK